MVQKGTVICPKCGGILKYYDSTRRMLRSKYGRKNYILIQRLRCTKCGSVHRELPNDILPYKHYDSEIIQGVIDGTITTDTFGFEDYPCEVTMKRWKSH